MASKIEVHRKTFGRRSRGKERVVWQVGWKEGGKEERKTKRKRTDGVVVYCQLVHSATPTHQLLERSCPETPYCFVIYTLGCGDFTGRQNSSLTSHVVRIATVCCSMRWNNA